MNRGRDFSPVDEMYPLAGLNYVAPAAMVAHNETPAAQNMVATSGIASKRKGYTALHAISADPLMALIEFEVSTDERILVGITTKRFDRYSPDADTWTDITQVVSMAVVEWTGTQDDPLDWVVARGIEGKFLIVTNGVDAPVYWDGISGAFVKWPMNLTNFITCKTVCQFYDHIFIGNVTTTSHDEQSLAWSNVGTVNDFSVLTADAGAQIVTQAIGAIIKFKQLGDRLYIYSENSITGITYLGGVDLQWDFELIDEQTRLVSGSAIVNLGPYHIFLGQQNWYLFDGSRSGAQPVGDKIWRKYAQELYVEQKSRAWGFLDEANRSIYWGVPTGNGELAVYQQEYDIRNPVVSRWVRQQYTDQPFCMGYFSRDSSLKWNSPSIANLRWRDADFTWNAAGGRKGFPTRVIGSAAGGVFLCDDLSSDDAGEAVEAFWDTADITPPQGYESDFTRWLEIELELKGVEVDVLFSTDRGISFTLAKHLDLTGDWLRYRFPIDANSRTLRIRLYNNCPGSTFSMVWVRVWYRPGGVR